MHWKVHGQWKLARSTGTRPAKIQFTAGKKHQSRERMTMSRYVKILCLWILTGCSVLILSGCGGKRGEDLPPPDLKGDWIQSGSHDDYYHVGVITDDVIEIYWYQVEEGEFYLYWRGTFTKPQDGKEPYTWESEKEVDTRNTKVRRYIASDDVKEFTYEDGKITYVTYYGRIRFYTTLERSSEGDVTAPRSSATSNPSNIPTPENTAPPSSSSSTATPSAPPAHSDRAASSADSATTETTS